MYWTFDFLDLDENIY